MSRNNYYTKGNVLNCSDHQNFKTHLYRFIKTNKYKYSSTKEDHGLAMFFITENHQKTIPNFSLDLLNETD